jgi:hypothetical protein
MVGIGCAAAVWGAAVLPSLSQATALEATAARVAAGEPFKTDALAAVIGSGASTQSGELTPPGLPRARAIVQLGLAEAAIDAGRRQSIDAEFSSLRTLIVEALGSSPSDSFLWLNLFWTENVMAGFRPEHLRYLRMSYAAGPNEGWVAVKRLRLSLALFEYLPTDLQELSLEEFARLVDSYLLDQAADLLAGPAWRLRDRLVARLEHIDARKIDLFAKALVRRGYDLDHPTIEKRAPRPWN